MNTLDRLRGEYPQLARALEDMFARASLQTRFARALARRAGLRRGTGEFGARTVLDGYFFPDEDPLARRYATDLTGASTIRLYSRSVETVYLFYQEPDEVSFSPFLDTNGDPISANESGITLDWRDVPEDRRTIIHLALSSASESSEWAGFSVPFSVVVEVAT